MAIIELLTGSLGVVIAKFVLALWLNEPDLRADSYSQMTDIFFQFTKDKLAARRGDRQFQVLSEKAAERLSYLYEIEYRGWSEDKFEPVVVAVADALSVAKITPTLLAKSNLDPAQLKQHILRSARKQKNGLNADELGLFDRLLSQSCELIIDYSSQLPSVSQRTLAEILNREEQLLNLISEITLRIKQIQENQYHTSFGGIDSRKFRLDYVRTVIRKLEWMELFGADLSSASKKHRLNVAYINLSLQGKMRDKGDALNILGADQAIQAAQRLFIRGAAGSGKTTLLKWIAVKAAAKEFEGELSDWNELTPFLIRLRECVDFARLPPPEDFPKLIAPNIHATIPRNWVHNLLSSGEAVVLIDGVDEIDRRSEVSKWIEDLTATFYKARFIVTSRPLVKTDPWETPDGFVEAELLPMGSTDIAKFIQYWHEAVKDELHELNEREGMKTLAEELTTAVFSRQALRNLASSPLLCAMICALHKDKDRQLPQNRLDLYDACSRMLLKEREAAQGIQVKGYPEFTYKENLQLLSDLAYYLLDNGYSEISIGRAKDTIARSLKSFPNLPSEVTPSKVVAHLVERSGMIFEPADSKIAFIHRSFQEYLAAYAAVDNDRIGVLSKRARDPLWREVVILAAGQANQAQRRELMQDLLTMQTNEVTDRNALDLLAIACMETIPNLDHDIQTILVERLKRLVPPTNVHEVLALAGAGDLAVPHLTYKKSSFPSHCIKALEMIGTEAAVQELIQYVNSDDPLVIDALMESLKNISNNNSSRVQLAETLVPKLEFVSPVSLELFQYIRNVNNLTIVGYKENDIDDLATLVNLRSLTLTNCKNLRSVQSLVNMRNLEELEISGCPSLSNLDALSSLRSLRKLTLRKLNVVELNEVSKLKSLQELHFHDLKITKLPSLKGLEKLTQLKLVSCTQLADLSALKSTERSMNDRGVNQHTDDTNAPNLREIVIGDCPLIRDLDDLEKKRQLQTIQLINYGNEKSVSINIPYKLREKVLHRKT